MGGAGATCASGLVARAAIRTKLTLNMRESPAQRAHLISRKVTDQGLRGIRCGVRFSRDRLIDMGYGLSYNSAASAHRKGSTCGATIAPACRGAESQTSHLRKASEGKHMHSTQIEQTWDQFKNWGDQRARDQLITRYAYLVKITAGRVVTSLPPNVDREDLVSAGVVGLVKAIDQFDRGRNVKFETYAIALIRGAILEMLREEDWVPRSVREKIKLLERTFLHLEAELGRPATDEEIADHLEIEIDQLHKMLADAGRAALLSLDDIVVTTEGSERIHLTDVVQDHSANTVREVELRSVQSTLGDSIDRLPEREQLVISLYYYEGLTFREIGKILGVSESRVYQLHTQAVIRMRGYLQRDVALFTA